MRAWWGLAAMAVVWGSCKSRPADFRPPPPPAQPRARPLTDRTFERTPERRARGQYLVEGVLQCFMCHAERDAAQPGAPPVAAKRGAGRVLDDTPDYRMVAPNITPDVETGAGSWTDDMLARAIREGIGHDGRALSGPMWWWAFRNLSDEDLASVVVYIRSLPPVRNPLPRRKLPPERERALNAAPRPIDHVPARDLSDPVARGRYLLRIADCSGCHSAWEAPVNAGFFGGGNDMDGKIFSLNISPSSSGISYYDDDLFIEVMRTGRVKARALSSIMPWVVFRNMTDDDLKAVLAALRAEPPVNHSVSNVDPPTFCPRCRQKHGLGEMNKPKAYPAFDGRALLDDYAGRYRDRYGGITELRRKGDALVVIAEDLPPVEIRPISATEADGDNMPFPIRFVRDREGQVTQFIYPEIDDEVVVRLR
jgi:mono/diheme cytochrome c family protein